jgi:hypothetical protein
MKKTKLPSIISILVLTLITVIMWVSFDVYRAIKKPTEITVAKEISQSLTPSLDQDSIQKVETRNFLDDSQIPSNIITVSPASQNKATTSPTTMPTTEPAIVNASGSGVTQ